MLEQSRLLVGTDRLRGIVIEMRTYKVTDYDMAMRKKKAVNGKMYIEFHNGLKWYVVKWYESED